ncbi:hypothetical protein ACHAWF_007452, partial [Thalassiosira exigua]
FGVPHDSNATVVSSASAELEATLSVPSVSGAKVSRRRQALPTTLLLAKNPLGEPNTSTVPEFLCHLFSMLRDPSYSKIISWVVPPEDESDRMGGGIKGIGKIVIHQPEQLQDNVLGRYYRHSKYSSFQRQLNYFGFKKRLHDGKKGKLSPCSFIHERLTDDAGSLLTLKRRPPTKKRVTEDEPNLDSSLSISSLEDASSVSTVDSTRSSKKRRLSSETKPKKMEKECSKSRKNCKRRKDEKKSSEDKKKVVITSMPLQVQAEEYAPPSTLSAPILQSNSFQVQKQAPKPISPMSMTPLARRVSESSKATVAPNTKPQGTSKPTLLDLLSISLPPPHVLFDDSLRVESMDKYHHVDSSLIDLAMIY